jgi:hypothetical protein
MSLTAGIVRHTYLVASECNFLGDAPHGANKGDLLVDEIFRFKFLLVFCFVFKFFGQVTVTLFLSQEILS